MDGDDRMKLEAYITKLGPKETVRVRKSGMVVETTFVLEAALKKVKYDEDENVVNGTGDPWCRVKLETSDDLVLTEFAKKGVGERIEIEIKP